MLTILGWLWQDKYCKAQYEVAHVNTWCRMLHRNLTIPHEFKLVTDQPDANYDPLIKPVPIWDDWRHVSNPRWPRSKPQCYIRLKAFSEEARELIGERFVSIDLDCLVLENLDSLFSREEDFLIYHRHVPPERRDVLNVYQGSMWMMTAGARKQVWEDFKGESSAKLASQFMGSDQAWIRYKLGPDEKGWTEKDGVYSFASHIKSNPMRYRNECPRGARLIFFQGGDKPWMFASDDAPRCPHCRAVVEVKPPWALVKRGGGPRPNQFRWIGQMYG